MVKRVLNDDPVEAGGFGAIVEKVFVSTGKQGGVAELAPVVYAFLNGIVVKFEGSAIGLNAVHGKKQAGSTIAAAAVPDADGLLAGIGIDKVFFDVVEPLNKVIPPEMPRRLFSEELIIRLHFGMHFQFFKHQFKELFG